MGQKMKKRRQPRGPAKPKSLVLIMIMVVALVDSIQVPRSKRIDLKCKMGGPIRPTSGGDGALVLPVDRMITLERTAPQPSLPRPPKLSLKSNQTAKSKFVKDKYADVDLHVGYDDNNQGFYCPNSPISEFTTDYEYEQGQKQILVKGRLKEHVKFWVENGASEFIIDTIKNGYKIPFITRPDRSVANNNKSALNNSDFVQQAINDLLVRGLAIECDKAPIVVNKLSVSTNNNKKMLILDLRKVNLHMWKQSIKYEDIHTALQYVESNGWMIKFDIHSAYHRVDIFPEHTEYLGFSWKMNGTICFFKFFGPSFWLKYCPLYICEVKQGINQKWRSQGIQILMYLDYGFACANCSADMLAVTKKIKGDLIDSGFVPKNEKSQWDPVQNLEFLGIEIDTKSNKLSVPKRRIDKALSTIQKVKDNIHYYKGTKVRLLASLVGQLISMHVVVGNVVYIMTKSISTQIAQSQHWDNVVQLNINTVDQIEYWYRVIRDLEPKEILNIPYSHRIDMYSDASSTGYGGFSVQVMGQISHGMWSQEKSLKNSTWRELAAVARVLDSMQKFLSYNSVKWFTNSQSVVSVVSKGSMKPELQSLVMYIFNLCVEKHISIEMEWIPCTLNEKADYLSRIVDYDAFQGSRIFMGSTYM